MTLPQHPGKHAFETLTDPLPDHEPPADPPETAILTFQRSLFEPVVEQYGGREADVRIAIGEAYHLAAHPDVVVVGDFGIGAPTLAMVLEQLFAQGVERAVLVGYAGSLDPEIEMGDVIVADRALRDEGTSHHYLEPGRWVAADEGLRTRIERTVERAPETLHVGPTWTVDAVFRETPEEVERYAEDGVLTVEMEAAAAFAVGAFRDRPVAAAFVVSDYLTPDGHERHFDATEEDLRRLFELARDAVVA